jgi:hypothetical protein
MRIVHGRNANKHGSRLIFATIEVLPWRHVRHGSRTGYLALNGPDDGVCHG